MKKFTLIPLIGLTACMSLVGCSNSDLSNQTDDIYNNAKQTTSSYSKQGVHAQFTVHDSRYVNTVIGKDVPKWQEKTVEIHANKQPLSDVMDVILNGTSSTSTFKDNTQDVNVSLNFKGSIADALNKIVAEYNIGYTLTGNNKTNIEWGTLERRSFDVAFMPGSTAFSVGNAAEGSGDQHSLSGNVNVWDDIQSSAKKLLSRDGSLHVSEATSQVTVMDHPSNVEKVQRYINEYNEALSKRVKINVKVIKVALNQNHQYGIDWNMVYDGMSVGMGSNFGAGASNVSSQAVSGGMSASTDVPTTFPAGFDWAQSNLLIQSLDSQGKTSVEENPTVSALNNTPSTLNVTYDETYIKNVTVNSDTSDGSSDVEVSAEPGNIQYGLKLTLIPHVQNDRIYLSLDGNLSTLDSLEYKSFGPSENNTEIGLPNITSQNFNQNIMVKNGETMVLSGLNTNDTINNNSKNFSMSALGSNQQQIQKSELIILLQPEIIK